MKHQSLVIGLDGVLGDLLLSEKDHLPHLSLLKYKSVGHTHSGTLVTVPGWTTILSGHQQRLVDNSANSIRGAQRHLKRYGSWLTPRAAVFAKPYFFPHDKNPGILDAVPLAIRKSVPPGPRGAAQLIRECDHYLDRGGPLAFLYLDNADICGHKHGFGSAPYRAVLKRMDQWLAPLLNKYYARDNMLILLVSDHGGTNRAHGDGCCRSSESRIPLWSNRLPLPRNQMEIRQTVTRWMSNHFQNPV
jgi:hypothetical protein